MGAYFKKILKSISKSCNVMFNLITVKLKLKGTYFIYFEKNFIKLLLITLYLVCFGETIRSITNELNHSSWTNKKINYNRSIKNLDRNRQQLVNFGTY